MCVTNKLAATLELACWSMDHAHGLGRLSLILGMTQREDHVSDQS